MNKNILLLSATLSPLVSLAASEQDRPNIVWLTSEDNSVSFVGCYGNDVVKTPNIDAMAASGVRYTNAFASAPASSPARNTLITGLYPTSLGCQHMRSYYAVPDDIKYFVEYMQQAGYYTINSGKMDYNIKNQGDRAGWDEVDLKAGIKLEDCPKDKPFFYVRNFGETHESVIFENKEPIKTKLSDVEIPPYLPDTKETRTDRACYYDKMEKMDALIGAYIQKLKDLGLYENTIIFYYSDNGGVLGRSKRFMYEEGLHIPLIIHFPEKYKHLAPVAAGNTVDDLVSYVDFAPTMLNMLGIEIPKQMQGQPFLGENLPAPRDYIYAIRGRMGESYDGIYAVRDKRYKYIRNYAPYYSLAQHINFLWKAEGMQAWEREYKAGRCNAAQSAFFETKPVEELYDLKSDPFEINNLAGNKKYSKELMRMRNEHREWSMEYRDAGLFSETEIQDRAAAEGVTAYEFLRMNTLPYEEIFNTAEMATMAHKEDFEELKKRLSSDDSSIRNWAVIGCIMQPDQAKSVEVKLREMAKNDSSVTVRITATEALFKMGNRAEAAENIYNIIADNKATYVRLYAYNVVNRMGDYTTNLKSRIIDLYSDYKDTLKRDDLQVIVYWKTQLGI